MCLDPFHTSYSHFRDLEYLPGLPEEGYGPIANVPPVDGPLEVDGSHAQVGLPQRRRQVLLDGRDCEHSAPAGHHPAILQGCACVEHLQPQLLGLSKPCGYG